MNFPIYFAKKIAFSKDNKNNLSRVIIFIGRLSVALGVIVSLITVSTGIGSKNAIKKRLTDFGGAIQIKSQKSNSSYNSSVLSAENFQLEKIKALPEVDAVQKFVTVSGIMRTEDNFAGIIFKGVDQDFDHKRFKKFLVEGRTPQISGKGFSNEITLSQKIAQDLHKKVGDSIVAIFSREDQNPIYRKFKIVGVYKTDIKMLDDLFVIGDMNHARKIQGIEPNQYGGVEVFLKNNNAINQAFPSIEALIGVQNYAEKVTDQYPQIVDWINIFDTNIALIITIMLVVVVINIIMVLLILIIERTNSIGMLKTLGSNNGQIRMIFIYYTLLIMVPGLLFGNLIGLGFLFAQKVFGFIRLNPENYYVSEVPVDLNPFYILAISFGILLVSAFALVLPSYLISKISPVKAIKYD
ncbi:ABC transporter permease [Bergeyella sp. RCAD1439]|uniref:ABC transporter permease n=1 Tax=Bergeyella anatis TaxID=3113737 RepID=UPI002E18B2A1|nr:FtsX-like permease family protein [Bergeyella sp. RCAD1439]